MVEPFRAVAFGAVAGTGFGSMRAEANGGAVQAGVGTDHDTVEFAFASIYHW
jgi:hypothetical protein